MISAIMGKQGSEVGISGKMNLHRLRKPGFDHILWFFVIIIVPLLTLWDLLFKPGLYAYADQHFPLSTVVPSSYIISLSPIGGFAFDRLFLSFPYFLFERFTGSIFIIERAFLYYTFLIYAVLCYVFSSVAVRYYSREVKPLSDLKKNGGKAVIFIIAYSNLSALNLNSDGGTWADSIILILIAISIILILQDGINWKIYSAITGMMILSFLLDPDYIPMFWIAVVVISVVKSIMGKNIRKTAYSIVSIALSSAAIAYLYLQSSMTGLLSSSGFNALGYRAYPSSLPGFGYLNINFYNVLILFGHSWSTIVFAPPSIISAHNIFDLPSLYSPAQVLIVPGIVYYLWLIALVSLPIIAFSSLIFKTTRNRAIPILTLFIVTYLITEEYNIGIVYHFIFIFTKIPVIGSAIGTAFSLPGHFLNLMAFTYLPLFSLGSLTIIYYSDRIHVSKIISSTSEVFQITLDKTNDVIVKNRSRIRTLIVVMIIASLMSLAGWQAFNGSYYPMRSSPGSFLEGNAVEPKGVFSPTPINGSVLEANNIVNANYSEGYNTLWLGGPSIDEFTYAGPQNSVSESGLSYLLENNLTFDILPYLTAHSIRYVVISGQDISSTSPNPFSYYGFSNYTEANNFFASILKPIYSRWNVSVYQVPVVNNYLYDSNLLLNDTDTGSIGSALYGLFSIIGKNVSMSASGISTGLDNSSDNIDILTPSDLAFSGIVPPEHLILGKTSNSPFYIMYENSTLYSGYQNYYQNNSLGQFVDYLPGNFTTTSWGGNTSFIYSNGTLEATGHNSSFSLGYNGALAGQPGGIYLANQNRSVTLKLTFEANSSNLSGYTGLNIVGEEKNASIFTLCDDYHFVVSNNKSQYQYMVTFPIKTAYLGFRIGFYGFSGTVKIDYANITVAASPVSKVNTPFGEAQYLSNENLSIPNGFEYGYIICENGSSIISRNFSKNITDFNGSVLAIILMNNSNMATLQNFAVINEGVSKAYQVIANGSPLKKYYTGIDGSYIFPVNGTQNIYLVLRTGYVTELTFVYAVLIVTASFLIAILLIDERFYRSMRFGHIIKNVIKKVRKQRRMNDDK
jgi:hypothetical protein